MRHEKNDALYFINRIVKMESYIQFMTCKSCNQELQSIKLPKFKKV